MGTKQHTVPILPRGLSLCGICFLLQLGFGEMTAQDPGGEATPCLECHSDLGQWIARPGMTVHAAITDGDCTMCHDPHGDDGHSQLVDHYSSEPYVAAVADSFSLCFLCHDTGLLSEEETDWATGFRDGTRNLHRVHIQGEKGRNCTLCHDMHASPNPFLVADRVPFGSWQMEMKYEKLESGGSCQPGCHGSLTYKRE
ncbi:MAG: cytochrome c3 family protein [Bacteroidales bacterium]